MDRKISQIGGTDGYDSYTNTFWRSMHRFRSPFDDWTCRRGSKEEVRATFLIALSPLRTPTMSRRWSPCVGSSPEFLWITRGTPVWGADAAISRFATFTRERGSWSRRLQA